MTPIRVLIVDDEAVAREGIRRLLADEPDVEVVGECAGGRQALEVLSRERVDLLFLDVQMPVLSGFDLLRRLPPGKRPITIFVTAYDRYAIRAFEENALDYLLKPFGDDRFRVALERGRRRLRDRRLGGLPDRLARLLAEVEPPGEEEVPDPALQRLVVKTREGIRMVDLDEVEWIRAQDYYAEVRTGGRSYLMRETMRHLERRLPADRFVRPHRSWIVNLAEVAEMRSTAEGSRILLRDGTDVPVARSRKARVKARLEEAG